MRKNVTSLLHPLACSIAYLYISITFLFLHRNIGTRYRAVYLALNVAILISLNLYFINCVLHFLQVKFLYLKIRKNHI